ncbi:MAG: EAL domain-containing protein [Acinetobacter sp.]
MSREFSPYSKNQVYWPETKSGEDLCHSKKSLSEQHLSQKISAFYDGLDVIPHMLAFVPSGNLDQSVFNKHWLMCIEQSIHQGKHAWLQMMHPEDFEDFSVLWNHRTVNSTQMNKECRIRMLDHEYHWCLVTANRLDNGRDWLFNCVNLHHLLTENHELADKLQQNKEMLDVSVDCIKEITPDGRLIHMNKAGCLALGVPVNSQTFNQVWLDLLPPEIRKVGRIALKKARLGQVARFSGRSEHNGQIQYWDNILTPQFDLHHQVNRILCVSRNISEQRKAEIKLKASSQIDELTGLLNRRSFKKKVQMALARAKRYQKNLGILVLDLDHFKHVNDTLGHAAGDHLLRVLTKRIVQVLNGCGKIARLGGDEFAILVEDIHDQNRLMTVGNEILKQFEKPIVYADKIINGGMSIGAATYPLHSDHYSGLMRCADIALNDVKAAGRGTISIYSEGMQRITTESMSQLNLARSILRDNCIVPHYQPKFNLITGKIMGFEALLRWRDEQGLIQLPQHLVESFENYELATKISHSMQQQIFQDMAHWIEAGLELVPVSINIAPIEFLRDDCAELLLTRMAQYDIPAHLVQIEITEHIFTQRARIYVTRALQLMRAKGIKIALDDFGTGYSSLTHLRDYAVDYLKIDRDFVNKMNDEQSILAIVKAICQLAPSFSLDVVAEGIENSIHKETLIQAGCLYGQGYLYSAAIAAQAVPEFLNEHE